MRDITVVMPTIDRSPRPNHLAVTLANLERSGFWRSRRLHSFHLVDSGGSASWPSTALKEWGCAGVVESAVPFMLEPSPEQRRRPTENAAAALARGVESETPWILFMEDDLDFCADILGSIGRWLDRHAHEQYRWFVFGSEQPAVDLIARQGQETAQFLVSGFWGTQCFAIRRDDARTLVDYWLSVGNRPEYDLHMHKWMARYYPAHPRYYLASCPSFVSHLGRESVSDPGKVRDFRFPSWPGRTWGYRIQQEEVAL